MTAAARRQSARAPAAPDPARLYQSITAFETAAARGDWFIAHVLACVSTLAIVESRATGRSVGAALGLDREQLAALLRVWLPGAAPFVSLANEPPAILRDEEEAQLFELLNRYRRDSSTVAAWIASIVTRRALAPSHLWQDLGLTNRGELTSLMERMFPGLAGENVDNMKWKKFFYRKICELEGFTLCAAPTCRECGDFDGCFGDENGEGALARLARR